MNVREWMHHEMQASGKSDFDLFHWSWQETYGRACRSNQVLIDLQKWRKHQYVPHYVWSTFEKMQRQKRVLPERAVPRESRWAGSYHRGVPTEALKLVDSSPILFAHKDKDGVWRC